MEWSTRSPVTIRSFALYAAGDDRTQAREFAAFRLLAKPLGETQYTLELFKFEPTHPYRFQNAQEFALVSSDVKPTTAREFRAEFTSRRGFPPIGPRIYELDGFETFRGTKATIRVSEVNVCWSTASGVRYLLEFTTDIQDEAWTALGDPIIGNGEVSCISDKVLAGAPQRYYRIRPID